MDARSRIRLMAVLGAGLFALWLLLSGHFEALLLSLGVVSVLLCVWIAARMHILDAEMQLEQFLLVKSLLYLLWLTREIALSAWSVARIVVSPSLPISPTVVRLPVTQRTDMGRAIYANSITLTPGTVSIDLGDDFVEVHALTEEAAQGLSTGEMDARVSALERTA